MVALQNYAIAKTRQKEGRAGVDFLAISVFAVSPQTYLGRRPINSRLMIPGCRRESEPVVTARDPETLGSDVARVK